MHAVLYSTFNLLNLIKVNHYVDVAGRLRSSDVTKFIVPPTRRSNFGDYAFPLAVPRPLEPFACVSPSRDVLIDVSSRTEVIPLPTLSLTCYLFHPCTFFSDHQVHQHTTKRVHAVF